MNGSRRLHRPARGVPRRLRWRDAVARSRPRRDPCRAAMDPPGSSCHGSEEIARHAFRYLGPCPMGPHGGDDRRRGHRRRGVPLQPGPALGQVPARCRIPDAPTSPRRRHRRPPASTLAMAPMRRARSRPPGTRLHSQPGTYTLSPGDWPADDHLRRAGGWWNWLAGVAFDGVLVDAPPPATDGSGWGVVFMTVGDVSRDPCDPTAGRSRHATSTRPRNSLPPWRPGPGSMRRPPSRSRSMVPTASSSS